MMKQWIVDNVVTTKAVTVSTDAPYRSVVDLLVSHRFSAVPVVDAFQLVLGVVSKADLLRKIEYAGDEQPGYLRVGATAANAARPPLERRAANDLSGDRRAYRDGDRPCRATDGQGGCQAVAGGR